MILFIDTSNSLKICIKLNEQTFEKEVLQRRSPGILPFIEECLKKSNATLSDITEIKTAKGPGSFTGLRVGVSIAQALGWQLQVLVNGKRVDKGEVVEIEY